MTAPPKVINLPSTPFRAATTGAGEGQPSGSSNTDGQLTGGSPDGQTVPQERPGRHGS